MVDANILFLGSGDFGLPALCKMAQEFPGKVSVGSVPPAQKGRKRQLVPTIIQQTAQDLELPFYELPSLKKEYGDPLMEQSKADIVIVSDFRLFLTKRFLKLPPHLCYNLHPSLLPKYRGAAPIPRAMLAGEEVHGLSIYQMVREMDAGPLLTQQEFVPPSDWNREQLAQHLSAMAADMIVEWIPKILAGDFELTPQDESAVSFAPKLSKPDGWIQWHKSPREIELHVQALAPWPRSFCEVEAQPGKPNQMIFLDEVEVLNEEHDPGSVGVIRELGKKHFDVACGADGRSTIRVLRVQKQGKSSMGAGEFLRGARLEVGSQLLTQAPPVD